MKLLPYEHALLVESAIKAAQAADDLPAFDMPTITIQPPKNPDQGDYAAAIAMQLAKPTKLAPLAIANAIVKHMPTAEFISAVEVAPPGFINFRLSADWLRQQVEVIIAEGDALSTLDVGHGQRAQVEFVSANPTAPLHVGRSRGAIVGDTIARLLEAAGYTVEREYYFNNAGVQMRNLGGSLRIRYLQALGRPIEIPGADDKTFYQGEYLVDFAKKLASEKGDSLADADWQPFKEYAEQQMFGIIKATLARVSIRHDVFFNENSLYDTGAVWETLERLDKAGYIYKAAVPEGASEEEREEAGGKGEATWFRSTALGDSKDRVLVKSDGNPTYTLPDIAYHLNKIERGFNSLVNVLGADHGTQYKVVQYGVQALGYDPSLIHVIIIQLVRMVRNGEIMKMSSRAGAIDTLDDLIDQTSADAVRYNLLARSANSHLDFDLDLAVKQSNENAVYYVQYAHVRCAGIFRKAAELGLNDEGADLSLLGPIELAFIRKALELSEQIDAAAKTLEPHKIAFYALELANMFHPVFEQVYVIHSDIPDDVAQARLRFYRAAQVVLRRVLNLMGMGTPDQM